MNSRTTFTQFPPQVIGKFYCLRYSNLYLTEKLHLKKVFSSKNTTALFIYIKIQLSKLVGQLK
jgi:hypothetical protein